jgi:hypothetical protein
VKYTWAYAQTHVFKISVCKGFQWALYEARDKHGPQQALVNGLIVYKGV